jgi:DNA-binding protein, YbaB/EbfC family
MFKQMGNMAGMMKQVQEMQSKMAEMQEKLDHIEVEGQSGAGLVKMTATAKGEIKSCFIDPSLLADNDASIIEDLVVAAANDARDKAAAKSQEEMAAITQGLPLPPGFNLG